MNTQTEEETEFLRNDQLRSVYRYEGLSLQQSYNKGKLADINKIFVDLDDLLYLEIWTVL